MSIAFNCPHDDGACGSTCILCLPLVYSVFLEGPWQRAESRPRGQSPSPRSFSMDYLLTCMGQRNSTGQWIIYCKFEPLCHHSSKICVNGHNDIKSNLLFPPSWHINTGRSIHYSTYLMPISDKSILGSQKQNLSPFVYIIHIFLSIGWLNVDHVIKSKLTSRNWEP